MGKKERREESQRRWKKYNNDLVKIGMYEIPKMRGTSEKATKLVYTPTS
jgi:hypothetical protein